MILYFSGTGGSKFAAKAIANYLQDKIVSLNNIIKQNSTLKFESENPFIIIAPIYAWRFPRIIENLVLNAEFIGNNQLYFVGTMASETGNCDKYCKRLSSSKNMEFKGFCGVPMPNNYIVSDSMADDDEIQRILSAAIPILKNIANKIQTGSNIGKIDKTSMSALKSGAVNSMFIRFMDSSKDYIVSNECISCKKCKKFCPVNNIEIVDGKPVFGNKCIQCFGCLQRCPIHAINIKDTTQNRGRYVCPEYCSDLYD